MPKTRCSDVITGLLIARGDTILVERYQYARNDRHRFTSQSMAQTVTSVLVGIAIAEGHIRAVDDPVVAYVVALAGTEYGRTPLRHLLQMSSGVRFGQQDSGRCSPAFSPPAMLVDLCVFGDDVVRLVAHTFGQVGSGGVEAVKPFNDRVRPSGTIFSYSSLDTQVLGLALRSAVGRPVADYGFVFDQTGPVQRLGYERMNMEDYAIYQMPIKDITKKTGVVFDQSILDADVLKAGGAPERIRGFAGKRIESMRSVILR